MLQALREKSSGIVAKIVLGALIIVFSFFGIESYFIARTDTWVAKVGKREITPEQFTQRFGEYRQQMQRMMGAQFDGSYFEKPATKRQVLDGLIDEQLMLQANDTLGVVITDQRVQKEIIDIPAFQTNGKFDSAIYRATLSASGKSPTSFQEDVRRDLAASELRNQISATTLVTPADVDAYVKLRDETRDVDYVTVEKTTAAATAVSDADIDTYFKEHAADFASPEQVSLEYIEIDASKVKLESSVDEAAIKERYEKDKTKYVSPEQRLVSHILVKVEKNADADAQKKALAKAQDLAKQAKTAKDFGALAKTASDDLGSKAQGGDLGWIEKGVADPAFETALFEMKKGDISEPVLSPEGYHIIDLRDIRAEHARTLDEVRVEITKELQDSERERGFNDLATQLTDSVYSNAGSLEPTAKKLGLEVQKTPLITRQGGPGIAGNPAVLKAAFSDAVLVEGNVSDPIDIGQDHKIAIRVAEHKASAPKPLDSVKEEVRAKLVTQQSAKASRERADALLKRLRDGESLDKIADEVKGKVEHAAALGRTAANVDSQLTAAVFKMPRPASDAKPSTDSAALANDAYALVVLKAVHEGDPSKVDQAGREQVRQQLQQQNAGLAARAFVQSLRKSTKIEVAEERIQ